jgi:galactokinase
VIEVRAPGRVNLIGEHTDYNDGFVMPAAIGYYTHVRARRRDDRIVTVRSDRFPEPAAFQLDRLPRTRRGDWADYARGILIELAAGGIALRGADVLVTATLPLGAGLSSSASFEIALALAMLAAAEASMESTEIARLAQCAEHEHVGIRSGIMDQFAVLRSHAHHAMLLDTRTLEVELVPVPERAAIVVANTMVKHALAASEYNARRAECEAGVRILQQTLPRIRALRDVTLEMLEQHEADLPAVVYRRCRHVVTEDARAGEAANALRAGNLAALGSLLNASHESLKNDYEVSCPELDRMVEIARTIEGVYGARMTGGGFGGCTVNLVAADRAAAFARRLARAYRTQTGTMPEIYDGTPVDGAQVLHA